MRPIPEHFVEPSRTAPVDVAATLAAIPETVTIAGMYSDALVTAVRKIGAKLPSARERYTPFGFYPLAHHVGMLIEGCALLYPELPLRASLRKLGRAAPRALLSSTVGRVTVGAAEGVHEVLAAMAKTYAINIRPSHAEVVATSPTSAVVRVESVGFFLDSHHVGVFEGAMRHAGVDGKVLICAYSDRDADFLCTWG